MIDAVPAAGEPALQESAEPETTRELRWAEERYDEHVDEARRALLREEQSFQAADRALRHRNHEIESHTQELEEAKRRQAAAAQQAESAEQAYQALRQQVETRTEAGAPAAELEELRERTEESRRQLDQAREETSEYAEQAKAAETDLEQLQADRREALDRLREAEASTNSARNRVEFLESPLAPHKIVRWLLNKGPMVLVILSVMFVLGMLARIVASRIVMGLVRRGGRGTKEEREKRADTLRRAFQSLTGVAILAAGVLALLEQFGIDVTVLVGGAAVLGMAIAFGAQTLIRDYFHGFMILFENQYSVGNVVKIGDVTGLVEDITLRMTMLRDLEGTAHFIPHGQVTMVSNLTYGWSRAVFDIGVAYKEDLERVMEVLMALAREMRGDPDFGHWIVDEPEMLGVEAFGDSAIVVRFLVKTRPLRQWAIKRELLRRIKQRFDELGIEIPFPHHTVFHRSFEEPLAVELRGGRLPDGSLPSQAKS
ncbi:MAG: mechanosensitive ion channel domain-containing protein [Pirellulales bacterium]